MGDSTIQFAHLVELVKRLKKPLTVFDLETSAFRGSPNFGICEVGLFTVTLDGRGLLYGGLVNPENMIEARALATHGITQQMVASQQNWGAKYAGLFHRLSQEHVISGFNIKTFDCPAVIGENARYGYETPAFKAVLDARFLYKKLSGQQSQSGKLEEIAAIMGVKPKGTLHRAQADVTMTVELLDALVRTYGVEAVIAAMGADEKSTRKSSKVSSEVLAEYVKQNGFTSFDALAAGVGVAESDLEYPLCQAVDRGLVEASLFAHAETRDWLRQALPVFVDNNGFEGKLKPLYERLNTQAPASVKLSYLQLRIGLLDAGYVWGMLKPETQAA